MLLTHMQFVKFGWKYLIAYFLVKEINKITYKNYFISSIFDQKQILVLEVMIGSS